MKTLNEVIAELMDIRDEVGGDVPVILSKTAEGDSYSPLDEVKGGFYEADSTYSGDYWPTEEDKAAESDRYDWGETPRDAVPAVFIWPAN